jgi:TolA-binding protein
VETNHGIIRRSIDYRSINHRSIEPRSIERNTIGSPVKSYDRPYFDIAPSHLVPSVRPSDAFREDVLRVLDPIIDNLKSDIQGRRSNPSPFKNSRIDESEIGGQQVPALQSRINDLEKEINGLKRQESGPDRDMKEALKALMTRIDRLESGSPIQGTCVCKDLDVKQKLKDLNSNIKIVDAKVSRRPGGANVDATDDISIIQDQLKELSAQNDYISDTIDTFSVEIAGVKALSEKTNKKIQGLKVDDFVTLDVFESQIHQIQNTIVNSQKGTPSKDASGNTSKDVISAISDLEKKFSKSQSTSLNQIQDQIDHLEGLIQVRATDNQEKFDHLELKIKGNKICNIL